MVFRQQDLTRLTVTDYLVTILGCPLSCPSYSCVWVVVTNLRSTLQTVYSLVWEASINKQHTIFDIIQDAYVVGITVAIITDWSSVWEVSITWSQPNIRGVGGGYFSRSMAVSLMICGLRSLNLWGSRGIWSGTFCQKNSQSHRGCNTKHRCWDRDKTEVLIIAPEIMQHIKTLSSSSRSSLRNLGVSSDQSMSFDAHIRTQICSRFFHLRNIAELRTGCLNGDASTPFYLLTLGLL